MRPGSKPRTPVRHGTASPTASGIFQTIENTKRRFRKYRETKKGLRWIGKRRFAIPGSGVACQRKERGRSLCPASFLSWTVRLTKCGSRAPGRESALAPPGQRRAPVDAACRPGGRAALEAAPGPGQTSGAGSHGRACFREQDSRSPGASAPAAAARAGSAGAAAGARGRGRRCSTGKRPSWCGPVGRSCGRAPGG
jgi:hypothetical protein